MDSSPGTSTAPIIRPEDYPGNPVSTPTSDGYTVLTIGPQGFNASGDKTPLELNDRIELYMSPANITMHIDGVPTQLNNTPGTAAYWANWISMTWRCRPGQQNEADSNTLVIPSDVGYAGVNSPLLVITSLTADLEGWEYSLEIHVLGNQQLYQTTAWVRLDIDGVTPGTVPDATISSYPQAAGSHVTVPVNGQVSFFADVQSSIAAENLSYQWEWANPAAADNPYPAWEQLSGETESVLTLRSVTMAQNGMQYRCRVTNSGYAAGVTGYTPAMTLDVREQDGSIVFALPIESSLINLRAGRTLTASVSARADNGSPVSYQWQVKYHLGVVPGNQPGYLPGDPIVTPAQAAHYLASSPNAVVSGATGAAMTTDALQEGVYEFQCRVDNLDDVSQSLMSESVYVVVTQESRRPYITPADGCTDIGVVSGTAAVMNVSAWAASDETLTYQWQTTTTPSNEGSWAPLSNTTPTLTISNVTGSYSGSYYRCIVGNPAAGEARVSGLFHLNIWNTMNTPSILEHPQNVSYVMGGLPEITLPDGQTAAGIQLQSTANVAQADTQGLPLTACWYRAGQTDPIQNGSSDPYGNRFYVREQTTSDQQHISSLTITGMAGGENAARAACGQYYCVWYKAQQEDSVTAP